MFVQFLKSGHLTIIIQDTLFCPKGVQISCIYNQKTAAIPLCHRWPTPPFKGYLGTFSGPAISGHDPPATLVQESYNWTQRLAQQAKLRDAASGVAVRRTEFISVHGGGRAVDPISGHQMEMGITLCYVLPTTTSGKNIQVPSSPLSLFLPLFLPPPLLQLPFLLSMTCTNSRV